MTNDIHLIGMGVMGCLAAWTLHKRQQDFTWEDNESPHTAWKASTGLIYPGGLPIEQHAYSIWQAWAAGDAPWAGQPALAHCVCPGSWWFSHKTPPHNGKYQISDHYKGLSLASLPTYHFNAQAFVDETRHYFAAQRRHVAPVDAQPIISHGFDRRRCTRYIWGWSAKVTLALDQELRKRSPYMPSLYRRKIRQLAYANPVPGEMTHYAGSTLIRQDMIKHYTVQPKYDTWQRAMEELDVAEVIGCTDLQEGWRPSQPDEMDYHVLHVQEGLIFPSLPTAGIRMAPLVLQSFVRQAGLYAKGGVLWMLS